VSERVAAANMEGGRGGGRAQAPGNIGVDLNACASRRQYPLITIELQTTADVTDDWGIVQTERWLRGNFVRLRYGGLSSLGSFCEDEKGQDEEERGGTGCAVHHASGWMDNRPPCIF
jgi:hypothetical protein